MKHIIIYYTYIVCNPFSIPDPVKLIGEGEYNLNAVKEIKVTESSLGLGEAVLECQDTEYCWLNHCYSAIIGPTKMYFRELKANFITAFLLYVITKTKGLNGKSFKGNYSK